MKNRNKFGILAFSLLAINSAWAQSGVGTDNPKATLDVVGEPTNLTKVDGVLIPRLTGLALKAKDDLYTTAQEGVLVYVTTGLLAGTTSVKTQMVNSPGYYYFDGAIWQKFKSEVGSSITAINGLNIVGNEVQLGGNLNKSTALGTSSTNTLKVTGLQQSQASDQLVTVATDGTLRKVAPENSKGILEKTYYVQGTTPLNVNVGVRSNVPGVTLTHTVPSTVQSQTLFFNVTGYVVKSVSSGPGVQGVFELYQNNTKISSAYASVTLDSSTAGTLSNLPVPCALLKSVTLTPGTYTFKIMYKSWSGTGRVNTLPSNYAGYDNDPEAMLTKMNVLIFNN